MPFKYGPVIMMVLGTLHRPDKRVHGREPLRRKSVGHMHQLVFSTATTGSPPMSFISSRSESQGQYGKARKLITKAMGGASQSLAALPGTSCIQNSHSMIKDESTICLQIRSHAFDITSLPVPLFSSSVTITTC